MSGSTTKRRMVCLCDRMIFLVKLIFPSMCTALQRAQCKKVRTVNITDVECSGSCKNVQVRCNEDIVC